MMYDMNEAFDERDAQDVALAKLALAIRQLKEWLWTSHPPQGLESGDEQVRLAISCFESIVNCSK